MESLRNQNIYDKCKKVVKAWECDFIKTYGRQPSKHDIREADKYVRDAYCTYFRLKTAALEETLVDILNEDLAGKDEANNEEQNAQEDTSEVTDDFEANDNNKDEKPSVKIWGEHLNKKPVAKPQKVSTKKEDMNSSFAKKLFANSKFAKRNPRKSQLNTSSQINNSLQYEASMDSLSQSSAFSEESVKDNVVSNFNTSLPVMLGTSNKCFQSVNVISQLLDSSVNTSLRKVDKGWLQRVTVNTKSNLSEEFLSSVADNKILTDETAPGSESDDIISDSDNEESMNLFHAPKRIKLSPNVDLSQKTLSLTIAGSRKESEKLQNYESRRNSQVLDIIENVASDSDYEDDILPEKRKRGVKTEDKYSQEKSNSENNMQHASRNKNRTEENNESDDDDIPLGRIRRDISMRNNPQNESIVRHKYINTQNITDKDNESEIDSNYEDKVLTARRQEISKFANSPQDKSTKINVTNRTKGNLLDLSNGPNVQLEIEQESERENYSSHKENKLMSERTKPAVEAENKSTNKTAGAKSDSDYEENAPVKKGRVKRVVQTGNKSRSRVSPNKFRNNNKKDNNIQDDLSGSNIETEDCERENDSDYEETTLVGKRKRQRAAETEKKSKNKTMRSNLRSINKNPSTASRKSTRKKGGNKAQNVTDEPNETMDTEKYELEYSVKPPPVTCPRFQEVLEAKSETSEAATAAKIPDKKQAAKNKLLKKIQSGTLNDNFVRLDMKKKIFVRGKKGMNFTKFKKQQWKNKKKALYGPDMDMGGCDGGELVCFKCGKSGHFARQCKAKTDDKLLPLDAVEEEDCLLPSLEEASKMAKESVLAVRAPSLVPPMLERNQIKDNIATAEENREVEKDAVSEADSKNSEYEFHSDDEVESFMLNADIAKIASENLVDFRTKTDQKWIDLAEENTVKPLYHVKPNGSVIDTPNEVFAALKEFGHTSFRAGQEQAVMRILSGQSSLVTLSTGSGKSLCYQLPAYLYAKRKNCVSLVISPLVSLMEDQVSGIPSFLKAACLHTAQTATQKEKVMKLIESGNLNILLVSPEAVTAGEKRSGFGSLLRKLPPIAFACIDEAHCVSQWSHNFRPSYLVICRVLRERLGIKTVLGLTATSTHTTSSSIVEHLKIPDGQKGVISDIPLPDNLYLSVSSDVQRDAALKNLLMSDPYDCFDSIIIYCTRREECERIAAYLRTSIRSHRRKSPTKKYKSLSEVAEAYHAGLPASKRRTVQNAFMSGHLRIVVATVAFGMGINKADIRGVIHYNMPRNFESYVQEVGRAGRDGLPAHCHLFLDSEGRDQNELRRHIYANSMDWHVIRKLLQKLFIPCGCTKTCPKHEVAFSVEDTVKLLDVPEENISTLLCYLELHERRYIEVLTPVYTTCKIISYGGPQQIKKAAQECPPLAMALAVHKKDGEMKENVFEFPVVDVAAAMGWDSGIVKSKLKNLEWITENNMPKRSALTVEFSNLGFHVRSPGNLSAGELDEALDTLYAKKKEQETTSLQQLQVVHSTLTGVAERFYHLCLAKEYTAKSAELKSKIRNYFSSEQPLKELQISATEVCNEVQIVADVRNLVAMYRDNSFTGRALARIFHGIQSPNYPAVIWGRCKFWRAHLTSDFNRVCQICTAEILKLK